MTIQLSTVQIDDAMPRIAAGLAKYLWIQSQVENVEGFHGSADFRRRFNHLYKVRRRPEWQDMYFNLMAEAQEKSLSFDAVLRHLKTSTNRYEASFASKLYATLNTNAPVIDAWVVKNAGLRLPYTSDSNRFAGIVAVHVRLAASIEAFLATPNGQYLIKSFECVYSKTGVTNSKKVDFVLWQTRV